METAVDSIKDVDLGKETGNSVIVDDNKKVDATVEKGLDQPTKDDRRGTLISGPGVGPSGTQPRPYELRKALPKLERSIEEQASRARRFAMEQSVAFVLHRQKEQQVQSGTMFGGNSAQRQRIISLMCRIYVGAINFDIREEAIKLAFYPFGPIRKIDMSWDSPTLKHKGFAFVEYEVPDSAQLSLEQMNNYMINGRPIKVGRPSNVPQAAPMIESILEEARPYPRVFIANIHQQVSGKDIRNVFEAFGKIKSCLLVGEGNPKHKGYAYVEYDAHKAANDAIMAMNMFELGGQMLRVGKAVTLASHMPEDKGLPPAAALAMAAVTAKLAAVDEKIASATNGLPPIIKPRENGFSSKISSGPITPLTTLINVIASPAMIQAGLSNVAASLVTSAVVPSAQTVNKHISKHQHKRQVSDKVENESQRAVDKNDAKPEKQKAEKIPEIKIIEPTPDRSGRSSNAHKSRDHRSKEKKHSHSKDKKRSSSKEKRRSDSREHRHSKSRSKKRSESDHHRHKHSRSKSKKSEVDTNEVENTKKCVDSTLKEEEDVSIKGTNARFLMMKRLVRNFISPVIILTNMVSPDEVDDELKDEIEDECKKFGKVSSVIINQERQGENKNAEVVVKIFVKFSDVKSAEQAQATLNGRYFAGRSIKADFYDEIKFENKEYSA